MSPLDAALDELYGAEPAEFVAARKRLAAELATAGEKDAAKELRAARRPSTSAWALNQMARLQPDVVEELLDRGADLVVVQTRTASATPEQLRAAIGAHRDALDAATDAALAILGSRANDGFRSEIVATLRAASTDEDATRALRTGRLVQQISPSGFPAATGLTLVPPLAPAATKPPKADVRAAKREAEAEAEAEAREREAVAARELAARRSAEHAAARDAALRVAAAADQDAERARARIETLHRELTDAEQELASALERADAARREADAAPQ